MALVEVQGLELQGTLWGHGTPVCGSFAKLTHIALDASAWIDHCPLWFEGGDELFSRLVRVAPWEEASRPMYDRVVDVPRLTAWIPSFRHPSAGMPAAMHEVADLLGERYGHRFDTVGLNLYRTGADSVAWHGDRIRHVRSEAVIAILSLGGPRSFLIRPRGGGRSRRFDLGGGDLLVMGGTCQRDWEHSVPKAATAPPRLSITFRHDSPRSTGRSGRTRRGRELPIDGGSR